MEDVSKSERAVRLVSVEAERELAVVRRDLESEAGKARMLEIERDALQQALQKVQAEFLSRLEQRGGGGGGAERGKQGKGRPASSKKSLGGQRSGKRGGGRRGGEAVR